jgi:glucose-6-phosphate 1-dehydrogenase
VTSSDDLRRASDRVEGAPIFYLALPNTVFRPTVDALAALDLTPDARIVLEKPFGKDLADARELNEALHRLLPEDAIFRVDHFLAKATVLNVLGLRFANRIFEPVWNAAHVERVEIVADETLGLEGRAGYYDRAGAARDMLQNHLLQLLALVAMEPPLQLEGGGLARRKGDVLRAVNPPSDVAAGSVRARYTAGRVDGRELPSYVDEDGVEPERGTETYAEITVTVDNWRWAGVPFRLRSGKALADKRSEIAVHFKPVPHLAFADEVPEPDVLRIRLTPDGIALEINLNGSGDPFDLEREVFTSSPPENDLPAYGLVLQELLKGDTTLSISDVEAEEGWRILEPVLAAWAADEVPLLEYPAGSSGPTRP